MPDDLRSQVDQAVNKRPTGLESIRKIYDHFALKDHGLTYKSFSAYVRREGWRDPERAALHLVELCCLKPRQNRDGEGGLGGG